MGQRVKGGNATAAVRADCVCRRVEGIPTPTVVEVGVFQGLMSRMLLQQHTTLRLVMVDNWLPGALQQDRYRATGDWHAQLSAEQQARFRKAAVAVHLRHRERSCIVDGDMVQAARDMAPHRADLVFLDADHSVGGTREAIEAWWPVVQEGGWIGGHDYGGWCWVEGKKKMFGVKEAVDGWCAERGYTVEEDDDYTWFVQKPS